MDSKTLWTVVIVAVVASLITAFVTVNLTGKVVSIPTSNYTQIYTKAEVDSKFVNLGLTYLNPTSCSEKKVIRDGKEIRYGMYTMGLECEPDKVLGNANLVKCDLGGIPVVDYIGYNSLSKTGLPSKIGYTCTKGDSWYSIPLSITSQCCNITRR